MYYIEAQGSVLIWAFALIFMHSLSIHGKNQCLKNRGKGWGEMNKISNTPKFVASCLLSNASHFNSFNLFVNTEQQETLHNMFEIVFFSI